MNDEEEETSLLDSSGSSQHKISCRQAASIRTNELIEANGHRSNGVNLLAYLIGEIRQFTRKPEKRALQAAATSCASPTTSDLTAMRRRRIDRSIVMQANQAKPRHSEAGSVSLAERSALFEHLIKLAMFLATIVCSQMSSISCQNQHYFNQQPKTAYLSPNEQLILSQQSAFDQLMRNNHLQQHLVAPQRVHRAAAERRVAPEGQRPVQASRPAGSQSQQQPQNDSGRLLVCYYTTRQSAPYWPKDAREFALPPEGFGGEPGQAQNLAPILNYEPFSRQTSKSDANGPQQAHDYGSGGSNQNAQNTKNQQQQLVFKSAAVQAFPAAASQSGKQLVAMDQHNGAASSAKKSKQDGGEQFNTLHVQHQPSGAWFEQNNNKPAGKHNKQSPVYSFVGEAESGGNNGLIVGGGGVDGGAFAVGSNGNNGNNLIISHKDGHNQNQNQQQQLQERNPMKQQAQAQQLVFSPSLSRAFIVGGPAGSASNNEALDTKSQLFIPQQPQHQQHSHKPNNNNQFSAQQVAAAKQASPTKLYHHELLVHKGKSLQLAGEQQVSPSQAGFISGAVASVAASVPLSSASSALVHSVQSPYQQFSQPHQSGTNQLIVGAVQQPTTTTTTNQAQKSPTPVGVNNFSSLEVQYSVGGASEPGASKGGSTGALLGSSTSPALIRAPPPPSSPQTSSTAALVSSPLSTMFDVFGAASQYLMRFKPSSLMSPSSFAFNTISSEHLQQAAAAAAAAGIKSGADNSSAQQIVGSQPSSLLPAPFPTGLLASLHHKSAGSPAASLDRSGSGLLSRFSLQNNQRREDVCGKTIQTPQRRIIGGEGARYGEFPYQVHIKIAKHQCGGALVDKQSIVTAAHCVYHFITRAPVNKLQIVIGAYDIEDEQYQELPPQYFKVNKVKLHPNFRFSASHPDRYDIAILKLDKPVKYTDNVLPVCLPSRDLKFESMVGTVTGFGKTDPSLSNRYGTRLLQKVDVPIIENNECERWHRTRGIDLKIFPEMMCAGYEDGLKDACVGDSGGPLVVKTASGPNGAFRWTLAGITSAGFGCAQSRQPGIYHRVSHTVDWILDNLD